MTLIESIKMTAEQYLQLGDDPPGVKLELVDGEIRVSPSPTAEHAYALSRLFKILIAYVDKHRLGVVMSDTDHVLTPFTVRRPDLYFFKRERFAELDGGGPIRIAPDLAIEVISPGSVKTDRIEKYDEYAEFGIEFYWLIDPRKKTAEAFKLADGKYVRAGSASGNGKMNFAPFPKLTIRLADLWWPPK